MKSIKGTVKNAWRIYRRDLHNIVHNPVAAVVVLGLLLLPSLYAWVNIYACWDPYGNTKGIKVAVVNLDEGVHLQGEYLNAGEKIVDNLKGNDAIGWQFVTLEEAERGLLHEDYYAMLEIPDNFSSSLVDVFHEDLTKPEIIYRVNEKSNAIAPKITDSGAKTVTNQVTKAIIEIVDQAAFTVGNEMGETLDDNQSKVRRLRDAVLTVNRNFAELEESIDRAQESLITVDELLDATSRVLPELEDGVTNLKDFSVQGNLLIGDAQVIRADSVEYLQEKFADCRRLMEETEELFDQVDRQTVNVADLRDRVLPILSKAEKLQEQLEEILSYLERLDIKDPDYAAWIQHLQGLLELTEKLTGHLEQAAQNPETVRTVFVTASRSVDKSIKAQLVALEWGKTELTARLEQAANEAERALLAQQLEKMEAAIAQTKALEEKNQQLLKEIEAMTPEELAGKMDTLEKNAEGLQADLRQVIGLIEKLQASGFDYQMVLSDLHQADRLMTDGLSTARDIVGSVDKGLSLSEKYLREGRLTLNEISAAMDGAETAYRDTWADAIDGIFGDLQGALNNLDSVLLEADEALPKLNELLATGAEGSSKGQVLLDQVNTAIPEAKAEIARVSAIMGKLTDDNLELLIDLMENDTEAMSDYFASPVELREERLYHLDNYGSAMTPFYTILAIWVGCLILSTLLVTEAEPLKEGEKLNIMEEYFGKYLTFLTISLLQALIIALGDKFLLGVTVSNLPVFIGFCLFSSFVFVTIVYTIVSVFGTIGKAVCVVLLVLQIAGAGGTFPVEVMPDFYQALKPLLPFTYAIDALRETISGIMLENLDNDFWHLALFWAAAVALGLLLKRPLHPLVEWFNRRWKESGMTE